jgi:hypothetical protein
MRDSKRVGDGLSPSLAGRASLLRKGNCLFGGRQPALREPPQKTWFVCMLVLKFPDVGLNCR